MPNQTPKLDEPILGFARKDFVLLNQELTVQQALDTIRKQGAGEKIVYFYVADDQGSLVGVVPTRRLLVAELSKRISDIMVPRVVTIPTSATVMEACEFFVMHRFLAFPVVDDNRRIVGVVDASQFMDEMIDLNEREQADTVFEALGFRLSQVRDAGPIMALRHRYPWLLTTIGCGTICAMLASYFHATLEKSAVVVFFLTMVLALAESVGIQSMTVTIQALRSTPPSMKQFWRSLAREVCTSILLGLTCGLTIFMIVWLWQQNALAAFTIGISVVISLVTTCIFGLTVPWILHALRWDPKIAAGPITLALTDVSTLLFYFTVATWML